jgi:uncharacterized protein
VGAQRPLITRRQLLKLGAVGTLPAVHGCGKRDQASVLSGLVTEVVLGMAHEVRAESRALHAAVRALSTEPDRERQRSAQTVLKRATLAWKRAYAFRSGPFVESEGFQRAAFWPARPTLIDAVLNDFEPIDEQRVQQLGVDARGLYALEYLLFDEANARAMQLPSDGHGERARAYALELSANVLGYANRMQRLLGDGRTYAANFSKAGKQSVTTLVTQTRDTLSVVSGKFARAQRARVENRPLPFAVEGYFSGNSHEIVLAIIAGSKRLYLGGGSGGLSALVAAASTPIDERVRAGFHEVEQRLREVDMPLEVALDAQPYRFRRALTAVAELENVIGLEMAGVLSS